MKHIAFDLGAESGRAIVGEIVEGKLTTTEIHRFPTQGTYVNGSLRWEIYRLYSELKKSLVKYVSQYGGEPCTMGVDTWGVDYGLLDRNGKLCATPYHYRDKRNVGSAQIIEEKLGMDRLYDLTGIQQMEINTLNQLISAKKVNDPIFKIGEKLLFIGDILHYFLCGQTKAEYTVATTSNLYSTINERWEDEVLEAFDIEKGIMPEVVKAGSVLGEIREDLAKETGVNAKSVVVVPAVHDTASAAAAVPGQGENIAFISSGTWSLAGLELDKACVSEQSKQLNLASYGGAFDKYLFLKNVMGLWLIQQARKQWVKADSNLTYAQIVEKAQKAQPFYGMIDPNDSVFLNPDNMVTEICEYLTRTGQKQLEPDNIGQIARIIFESLAFKYRQVFDMLSSVTGKRIEQLNVIGGGIQNQMLMQFTANAMGLKVIAGPVEASSAGNILIQAYGSGEIASIAQLREIVRDTFEPQEYMSVNKQVWEGMYQKFLDMTDDK